MPSKGYVLLLLVGIIVILLSVVLLCTPIVGYYDYDEEFLSYTPEVKASRIFISHEALKYIDTSELNVIADNIIEFDLSSIPQIYENSIVIVTVEELAGLKGITQVDVLLNFSRAIANTNSFILVWLNPSEDIRVSKRGLETVLKLYGIKKLRPLLPLNPDSITNTKYAAPQIHPALFKAAMIAFSINPTGVIVIEDSKKPIKDIAFIIELFYKAGKTKSQIISLLNKDLSSITEINGFNFIGYIGWKTSSMYGRVCNEETGYMSVKVDYYYASDETHGYKFWLAHVMHGAKGYETYCLLPPSIHHYPEKFISVTDWRTEVWPAQILDDWGPKNIGSAATISYTVSSGISVGLSVASASIEYSVTITEPNAPYFEWRDLSDPPSGISKVEHIVKVPQGYDIGKLDNVWFQVEPSSIGLLDPNKYGGVPPMVVLHYFETSLNTGDKTSISFGAYLFPYSVLEDTEQQ